MVPRFIANDINKTPHQPRVQENEAKKKNSINTAICWFRARPRSHRGWTLDWYHCRKRKFYYWRHSTLTLPYSSAFWDNSMRPLSPSPTMATWHDFNFDQTHCGIAACSDCCFLFSVRECYPRMNNNIFFVKKWGETSVKRALKVSSCCVFEKFVYHPLCEGSNHEC